MKLAAHHYAQLADSDSTRQPDFRRNNMYAGHALFAVWYIARSTSISAGLHALQAGNDPVAAIRGTPRNRDCRRDLEVSRGIRERRAGSAEKYDKRCWRWVITWVHGDTHQRDSPARTVVTVLHYASWQRPACRTATWSESRRRRAAYRHRSPGVTGTVPGDTRGPAFVSIVNIKRGRRRNRECYADKPDNGDSDVGISRKSAHTGRQAPATTNLPTAYRRERQCCRRLLLRKSPGR